MCRVETSFAELYVGDVRFRGDGAGAGKEPEQFFSSTEYMEESNLDAFLGPRDILHLTK